MKKRFAEPKNHKSIKEYDFNMKHIEIEDFKGHVALIDIKKVKDEWYVPRNNGNQVCILANNFKWLLFYPDISDHAISVIFNENGKIIEWYFDIVREMGMEDGMPYMIDLYLDLVITPEGETYILDEEELEEALKIHDITEEDFDKAYRTLNNLLEKYGNGKNINYLEEISYKYLDELLNNKIK